LSTRARNAAILCAAVLSMTLRAQEQGLAPARAGLRAVPLPSLHVVEPAVAEQLRSAQRDVEQAASNRASTRELAAAYGSLARLFHAYEIFDSAEAAYLNAARLASGDVEWPYLLGYLYQQTGRWEEAATRLTDVLRVQPARREAAARLAQIYLQLNRLRDARELFSALVDVFPGLAQNGLGDIALREHRFDDAVRHFRAALERVPRADSLRYSLAMAYRGLGRLEEAHAELDRRGTGVISLGDPAADALGTLLRGERLLVVRGLRALEAGDLRAAADWFGRAVAAAPESTTARTNLAAVLLRRGEHAAAIDQFEAVLQLDPDDEGAVINLAMALADRSRFADAVVVLTRAHERLPQSLVAATTLARILAAAPDRAVRDAPRALELAARVYGAEPSAVHAETVSLALAALSRCADAREWMARAVSAAEQAGDASETARLRSALPCGP
jgi:tetratricopeptide (TPR) repeat protein